MSIQRACTVLFPIVLAASCMAVMAPPAALPSGSVLLGNVVLDIRPTTTDVIHMEAGPGWSSTQAVVDVHVGQISRELRICDAKFHDDHDLVLQKGKHYRLTFTRTGDKAKLKVAEITPKVQAGKDGETVKGISIPSMDLPLKAIPAVGDAPSSKWMELSAAQKKAGGVDCSELRVGIGDKMAGLWLAAR